MALRGPEALGPSPEQILHPPLPENTKNSYSLSEKIRLVPEVAHLMPKLASFGLALWALYGTEMTSGDPSRGLELYKVGNLAA